MRMSVARRSKHLARRPHVGKAHRWPLGDLAFAVSGLYPLGNLHGALAFQPQFCAKFVIRQYGSRSQRIETNGSPGFYVVIDVVPDLDWSEGRRSRKPAHDDTHKTVVALVRGLKSGRCENLYRRVIGDKVWSRALRQCNFRVPSHHVLAERRVLRFLRARAGSE